MSERLIPRKREHKYSKAFVEARVPRDARMDGVCSLFMRKLHRDFRGKKSEISPWQLQKYTALFERAFKVKQSVILDALIKKGLIEPSAADTYLIRYDKIEER